MTIMEKKMEMEKKMARLDAFAEIEKYLMDKLGWEFGSVSSDDDGNPIYDENGNHVWDYSNAENEDSWCHERYVAWKEAIAEIQKIALK